ETAGFGKTGPYSVYVERSQDLLREVRSFRAGSFSPEGSRLLRDVGRRLASWFDEHRSRRGAVELLSSRRRVAFSPSGTRDRQSRADRSAGPHQSAFLR